MKCNHFFLEATKALLCDYSNKQSIARWVMRLF